jgi:hypothetical protein
LHNHEASISSKAAIQPWLGFLGLLIMLAAEILLLSGNRFVAIWMTPIMWTGYILALDAIVHHFRGKSLITSRLRELPLMILLSVGIWLIFEVYNFHLINWRYDGLPSNMLVRDVGFFWSFATIMPAVFETTDLFEMIFRRKPRAPSSPAPKYPSIGLEWISILAGFTMIVMPIVLPRPIASYFFALVWIGFIPLLEPINRRIGARSLLAAGPEGFIRGLALLAAGLLCGFLWETWNYQAYLANGAYWVYLIPEALRLFGWHYGMMPLTGLLGFPPFAMELSAFYGFFRKILGGDRLFSS